MQNGALGAAPDASHIDRVEHELGAQMVRDRPAHATTREDIDHRSAINPSLARAMLRDVGHPKLVGPIRDELTLHVVLEHCRQPVATAAPPPAMMHALQTGLPHQPLHSAMTDRELATQAQFGVHAPNPVGSSRVTVNLMQGCRQCFVGCFSSRWRPRFGCVVAGLGYVQHPAGHRGRNPFRGQVTDQPERHIGRTFSFAK
ncbi:hypothetical protein BJ959_001123 [Chryseoglobus frigidaquae]|uniref:Uncharacterized protein n=1 Tax=Microcella frigidaquae TaxID=424758 RepID=A0A840XLA5_9MICO|nr:hypothetical protein [Microcella frigidaquae]